jgi:hypothetical protein
MTAWKDIANQLAELKTLKPGGAYAVPLRLTELTSLLRQILLKK